MANTVLGTASNILNAVKSWANGKFALSSKVGAANGIATLDADGKVPSSQLPSYVDDVLEYSAKTSFPSKGETGKIYVNTADNKTYRWSGTTYVEISASLALGETSSTAYAGDKGAANASAISTHTGNSTIHVTSSEKSTWNNKGTYSKPSTGIPKDHLSDDVKTSLDKADTALQSHQDISGKADKASITAGTAGTSSATSGASLSVPYVTMNAQGIVTGYGTHTHTVTGFLTSHQSLAGYVPTTRKVAGKALSSDVTINIADIADLELMTVAEMTAILEA